MSLKRHRQYPVAADLSFVILFILSPEHCVHDITRAPNEPLLFCRKALLDSPYDLIATTTRVASSKPSSVCPLGTGFVVNYR